MPTEGSAETLLSETVDACKEYIRNLNNTLHAWIILAGHGVVVSFFLSTGVLSVLLRQSEPLCWPYFGSCGEFKLESPEAILYIIATYVFLILLGALLAVKHFKACKVVIAVINLLLFGLVSLDYRLRANEFYMLFWFNLTFLLAPIRRWSLPLILLSFYLWAGRLKLNYEWLSGSVLYHRLWLIPPRLTSISCAYVIVLEMVLIWGLLARRRWIRWAVDQTHLSELD